MIKNGGEEMKRIIALLLLSVSLSLVCTSCSEQGTPHVQDDAQTEAVERVDLWSIDVNQYVSLCEYSGKTIKYSSPTSSHGALIWKYVIDNSSVISYPEQPLKYYFNQIKAKYIYFAKSGDMSYAELLQKLGIGSEEVLWDEARELLKEDMMLHALLVAENISLSDEDKEKYFDKYVQKYVTDLGYNESYVREHMRQEIYDSMLYDKALEKLISLNEFVLEDGK